MGQQQIVAGFRSGPVDFQWNLQDTSLRQTVSAPTMGATLIDSVPIQPSLLGDWSIISWSIAFGGSLAVNTQAGFGLPFGRLGKIIGGLVRQGSITQAAAGVPWVAPMEALPQDSSGLAVLWDGTVDPVFPITTSPVTAGGPALAPVIGGAALPIPLQLSSGEQLQIGLWLTPSLLANAQLQIANATYTVNYDDGLRAKAGWGGG